MWVEIREMWIGRGKIFVEYSNVRVEHISFFIAIPNCTLKRLRLRKDGTPGVHVSSFKANSTENRPVSPEPFPPSKVRWRTIGSLCARWFRFVVFTHRDGGLDSSMIPRRMCLRIQDHSCGPQEILPYQPKPPPHPPMLQIPPASCKAQHHSSLTSSGRIVQS